MSDDCRRYIDSRQHRSDTFQSPNYPDNYPSDVVCQYTFQGHGRERVQINFTDFRLRRDVDDSVRTRKLVLFTMFSYLLSVLSRKSTGKWSYIAPLL